MKNKIAITFKAGIAVLFAAFLAFLLWAHCAPVSASAETQTYSTGGAYGFTIQDYVVEADVARNRVVTFKEVITVEFSGYNSHGIIRDFPLGGGVRYKNIKATCDNSDFSPYTEIEDNFLSYYLRGNGLVQGETRTYTLTYELVCPELKEEGYFPLDLLGYGWQTEIERFYAKVTLPDGLLDYKIYSGSKGTKEDFLKLYYFLMGNDEPYTLQWEGNSFTLEALNLPQRFSDGHENYCAPGITFDFKFEAGVLTTTPDTSTLWVLALGAAVVLLALVVKFMRFRQPPLVRTISLSAPDKMDPLLMGKLIDNSVDGEDMGALVFWFASEGYLTIDFSEDKDDPTIYRSEKKLPHNMPKYLKVFYEGLFNKRESVQVSALTNSFYTTSAQVQTLVNTKTANMYEKKKSGGMVGLFFVLTMLLIGGFSVLYPFLYVGMAAKYFHVVMAIGCLFPFVLSCGGVNLAMQRYYKWKKPLVALCSFGGIFVGCLAGLFCTVFDCIAYGFITKLLMVLFSAAAGVISGTFLVRSKEYNEQLGDILGFKQFILVTEKDKIAFMLKEQPDLYYHILPYAQVLGVTDAWTDKFEGLELTPPTYAHYSSGNFVFNCMAWNSLSRGFSRSFGSAAVSRPSSSGGSSGGFGGGFGGGHGGGGFGGGGGRGC